MKMLDIPKSGRLGKWVFYMRGRKQCRRRWVQPKDPRTPGQLESRGAFRRRREGLEPAVDRGVATRMARGRGKGPEPSAAGAIGKADGAGIFRREELRKGADWARTAAAASREREGGSRLSSTATAGSGAGYTGSAARVASLLSPCNTVEPGRVQGRQQPKGGLCKSHNANRLRDPHRSNTVVSP